MTRRRARAEIEEPRCGEGTLTFPICHPSPPPGGSLSAQKRLQCLKAQTQQRLFYCTTGLKAQGKTRTILINDEIITCNDVC